MQEIVLCADEESLKRPALIGLEGESLEAQSWLVPISRAEDARAYLRENDDADEVWVASSNEVDPINLAAALKKDMIGRPVYLLAFQGSGSLRSRASAAGIDGILDYKELANRYARNKRRGSKHARPNLPEEIKVKTADAARTEVMPPVTVAGKPASAYTLSVVSASGGTGKSTVSALSSLLAQALGYKTLLLDADLQFGDAALMLGIENASRIDELIAQPDRISLLAPKDGKPALISAPREMEKAEMVVEGLSGLIERVKPLFDVIIVNTGSFWTEQHIQLLESSSNSLFLLDQRPSSIQAGKRAIELCARCGVASHPFLFALNRCSRNALLTSIDISCAFKGVDVVELKDGGREVEEMMGAGMAMRLVESRNELCLSLEDFLLKVLPENPSATPDEKLVRTPAAHRGFPLIRRRRKAACL